MFIISYKLPYEKLDSTIEKLAINDVYNVFYENPLEITTDDYGYGYIEREDEEIVLKVAFEEEDGLEEFKEKLKNILEMDYISVEENNYDYTIYDFPAIHLDDKYVIASPDEEFEGKTKINFISQGAFGTGLHETTQDILKLILNDLNLKNKTVLDIGTGSGILSIAASISGAKSVVAVDIRDVEDEVMLKCIIK